MILVEQLREISNEKSNRKLYGELCRLITKCEENCTRSAKAGKRSQSLVIDYKTELDETINHFEKWMLDEGLTFMKDDTINMNNQITYYITW